MFECDCPPYDCAERVSRYLGGDTTAGDELAAKFQPLVWRIVQRVMGPDGREHWEDANQEALLRVFAKIDTWEKRCPFCKWLAVVAARRVIDFKRKPTLHLLDAPEKIVDDRPRGVDMETRESIDAVLSDLPVQQRLAWELWLNGIEQSRIAARVGKSQRTIQLWFASIREKLDAQLRP